MSVVTGHVPEEPPAPVPADEGPKAPARTARQLRRKRAPRALGPILLAVAVVGVAGYLVWSAVKPTASTTRYTTGTVERGTLTVAASGNGSVVVGRASSVSPQVSGVVANLDVALGDKVSAGQKLFTIVNDQYDDQVTQSQAQYKSAQASLISAGQRVTQAEQSVTQAKGQVQQTRLALAKAEQDYTKVRANAKSTDAERSNAYDQIQIAKTSLSAAQQGLDAAHASYTASKMSRESSYNSYQQAVKTAAKRVVTAPISGVVTKLNIQDGDSVGSGGSSSSSSPGGSSSSSGASGGSGGTSSSSGSSGAALVVSDLGTMEVKVSVSEVDRAKVKVGQKSSLTFDAVSDLTLTGKVTSIDSVGTNSSGVVTYDVTIAFDSLDERVTPGMTTAAAITTEVRTDVLSVPRSAVKTDTNGSYVLVMRDGSTTPTRVDVETGVSNDSSTEIASGLSEGDTIVTQVITPTTASSSSSGNRTGAMGSSGAFRMMGR